MEGERERERQRWVLERAREQKQNIGSGQDVKMSTKMFGRGL